jgi:hypothetical protein
VVEDGPRLAEQAGAFRAALAALQEPKWTNRNIPKITADLKLARDGAQKWRDEVDTLQKIVAQGAAGIVDKARGRLSDPEIAGSEAIKSYWTGAVAALDKKKDSVSRKALAAELEQLEATVKALNEGISVPVALPRDAARVVDTEAVFRAIAMRKERARAAAVGQLGQAGSANAAAVRQITALQEFSAWMSSLARSLSLQVDAIRLLDDGYRVDEMAPDGRSAQDLLALAEAEEAWRDLSGANHPFPRRVAQLLSVRAEVRTPQLLWQIQTLNLSLALESWSRLSEASPGAKEGVPDWPTDCAELERHFRIVETVIGAANLPNGRQEILFAWLERTGASMLEAIAPEAAALKVRRPRASR